MFEAGHAREEAGQALLEVLVEEAVHDGIGADGGHGGEMTASEQHQHHLLVLLAGVEWLEGVDDNVQDVERSPGEEEDDADRDQHLVCLPPPLHLSRPPGTRASSIFSEMIKTGLSGLRPQNIDKFPACGRIDSGSFADSSNGKL